MSKNDKDVAAKAISVQIMNMKLLFGLSMQPTSRSGANDAIDRLSDQNIFKLWLESNSNKEIENDVLSFQKELLALLSGSKLQDYRHALGRFVKASLTTGQFEARSENAGDLIKFFKDNPEILDYFNKNLSKLTKASNDINKYIATEYQAKNKKILPSPPVNIDQAKSAQYLQKSRETLEEKTGKGLTTKTKKEALLKEMEATKKKWDEDFKETEISQKEIGKYITSKSKTGKYRAPGEADADILKEAGRVFKTPSGTVYDPSFRSTTEKRIFISCESVNLTKRNAELAITFDTAVDLKQFLDKLQKESGQDVSNFMEVKKDSDGKILLIQPSPGRGSRGAFISSNGELSINFEDNTLRNKFIELLKMPTGTHNLTFDRKYKDAEPDAFSIAPAKVGAIYLNPKLKLEADSKTKAMVSTTPRAPAAVTPAAAAIPIAPPAPSAPTPTAPIPGPVASKVAAVKTESTETLQPKAAAAPAPTPLPTLIPKMDTPPLPANAHQFATARKVAAPIVTGFTRPKDPNFVSDDLNAKPPPLTDILANVSKTLMSQLPSCENLAKTAFKPSISFNLQGQLIIGFEDARKLGQSPDEIAKAFNAALNGIEPIRISGGTLEQGKILLDPQDTVTFAKFCRFPDPLIKQMYQDNANVILNHKEIIQRAFTRHIPSGSSRP